MPISTLRGLVALLLLASGSALAADRCEQLCDGWKRATDGADATFDASSGRLVGGSTQLPGQASVKVAVTDLNPFKFDYRVEVTAQPTAAALAEQVFGKYLSSVAAGGRGGASRTGTGSSPEAAVVVCQDPQAKALTAVRAAREARVVALEAPELFARDADQFRAETDVELLPRATCLATCKAAARLIARRDAWATDPDAALQSLTTALDRARSLVQALPGQPDPGNCYTALVKTEFDALAQDAAGWSDRFAKLKEVYPQLERLDAIMRSALGRDDAFALSRVQNLPSSDSIVRVNIYRRDLRQPGSAEAVVTSSELTVGQSPISLSLGIGALGLTNRTAVRRASPATGGTVGSVFAYDTRSEFYPAVVVLLNARFLGFKWKSAPLSLAASTGIQPATDSERLRYFAGLSLGAVDERVFFTLGAALGEVAYIDGGFGPDRPVPAGLQEIPTRYDWEASWFAAVTYRIR